MVKLLKMAGEDGEERKALQLKREAREREKDERDAANHTAVATLLGESIKVAREASESAKASQLEIKAALIDMSASLKETNAALQVTSSGVQQSNQAIAMLMQQFMQRFAQSP